jgi:hypothetical protein
MKVMKIAGAATVVLALTLLTGVIAPPSQASVSFDFFYSDLSPHGSWMVSGEYGRVWQPRIYRSGWNPYHDGHWVYTDCGWAWVSDYTWGDVAYHYGTWVMDPRFGWVWVPGYTWAPAWVTFRTGPDYIGWAPVAPQFAVGFSSGGFSFGASIPNSAFVFVSTRDFASPRLRSYIVPESRRTTIINRTTIVNNLTIQNNVVINRGPDLRTIERATRRTFRPQPIERVARVAPFTSFRRDQLAVARDSGDRVRAAEPISARQPLPPRMTDHARREYRRNPQLSQAPRRDQFRTPVETEAQVQQRDRMQQREDMQQREQRREEIQRQHPQEQRQQRFEQQQELRRQDEIRRQQEVERQREQREPSAQEQRRYAQPERRQQIEREREQSAQQERREVQRQREPSVQQEQRREQQVERERPQQQNQEQPQRPQRRAPKKKNPDDKDKKENDGGGNN